MPQVSGHVRNGSECCGGRVDMVVNVVAAGSLPDLGHPLEQIDHPVVTAAQAVPVQRDSGGAQRILSLSDRGWFKVKTGDKRAVVTQLRDGDPHEGFEWGAGMWWI